MDASAGPARAAQEDGWENGWTRQPDNGAPAMRVRYPRRALPSDAVRPTQAQIDLPRLQHNLRVVQQSVGALPTRFERIERTDGSEKAPQVWGVLKADAYGHGAPAVARTLVRAGIDGLCVALLEEAIELREADIACPILVMGGCYGLRHDGIVELIERKLTPVVFEAGHIELLLAVASRQNKGPIGVHLKVDTGMGRLGASIEDLPETLRALKEASPLIRLEGLMTHLACADGDTLDATEAQLALFGEVERQTLEAGLRPTLRHAANSAALLRLPSSRFDMVRPGIALFGHEPRAGVGPHLLPVMRVRTEVVSLRKLPRGQRIGYGHTWEAPRDSVVATVPIGYADGLSRALSNRGAALIRGKRAPVAGTVSMDLTVLDVTDIAGAEMGDEVVFLGAQEGPLGRDEITATEIAEQTGTIPWEVLTNISRRVPRFYSQA
ncbi:Alanine racemase [Chondromyces apiculatus DSM 436]|uniref:Alanine racemase n=2 Tax=Chondromyces apiculatus TaxID=51 RepID=A0A017T8Q3_9BACT|nr:Alanine racemase [Chondromyces apiculatus DSM 436]